MDMHRHRHNRSGSWSTYSGNHKLPWSGAQILSFNSRRKKTRGMLWSCWQNEVFVQDATVKIVYFTAKRFFEEVCSKWSMYLFYLQTKINLFILTGGKSNSRSSSWRNSKCVCQNRRIPKGPCEMGSTFSPQWTINVLSPFYWRFLCWPR